MALLEVHVGRVEMLGQTGINLIALLEVHVGRVLSSLSVGQLGPLII